MSNLKETFNHLLRICSNHETLSCDLSLQVLREMLHIGVGELVFLFVTEFVMWVWFVCSSFLVAFIDFKILILEPSLGTFSLVLGTFNEEGKAGDGLFLG